MFDGNASCLPLFIAELLHLDSFGVCIKIGPGGHAPCQVQISGPSKDCGKPQLVCLNTKYRISLVAYVDSATWHVACARNLPVIEVTINVWMRGFVLVVAHDYLFTLQVALLWAAGQGCMVLKFSFCLHRGFTKYSRDDYVQWKREGRFVKDGVNAKVWV